MEKKKKKTFSLLRNSTKWDSNFLRKKANQLHKIKVRKIRLLESKNQTSIVTFRLYDEIIWQYDQPK